MVKEGILEGWEGRNSSGKSANGGEGQSKHCYSPHEFSKSCVMIETNTTTLSAAQDNIFLREDLK